MAADFVPSGSTRVAGLIGFPARYSLSPAIHVAAYRAMGLDATYVVFPVTPEAVADAVASVTALQLLGVSVTLPHKEAVIPWLAGLSATAQKLGAVNTIVPTDEGLVGHNTDGAGFVAALAEQDFDVSGKKIIVIGAGGAARAVVLAVADAGASEIVIINRSKDRAEQTALLGSEIARVGSIVDAEACDLIVNATPVGMDTSPGVPIDTTFIDDRHFVADLIYAPRRTELLQTSESQGARTMNGLSMLVHQAAEQIYLWTGRRPDTSIMQAALGEQ